MALVSACSLCASAQSITPNARPLTIPDFTVSETESGSILPPLVIPQNTDFESVVGGMRVHVRDFHLRGNTVLDPGLVDSILSPYRNRALSFADLQAVRTALTQAYIGQGYITSGVLLPQQVIDDGVVVFQAVEGTLNDVRVNHAGGYEPDYFRQRLLLSASPVLQIDRIEHRLQRIQQDPRIASVRAALRPTRTLGKAVLDLSVSEQAPMALTMDIDNETNPSLGSSGTGLRFRHSNLTGCADLLDADLRLTEGLKEAGVLYNRPINAHDTSLGIHLRASQGRIIDADFSDLDIETDLLSYGVVLEQPLIDRLDQRLSLFAGLDRRRSRSSLLGEGFSFTEGPENGVSRLTLFRLGLDWQSPESEQISTARLQLTRGLDLWEATIHGDGRPDGRFTSLLVQAQHVRRFPWRSGRLILRTQAQWSNDPLMAIEQFALGGHATVRGYRENQLLRDQGLFGSMEARLALWNNPDAPSHADLAVFADFGRGMDHDGGRGRTLSSLGPGLLGSLDRRWQYRVYWAHPLNETSSSRDHDLQDEGLHFWLGYRWQG